MTRSAAAAFAMMLAAACKPAPVETLDAWLSAYTRDDIDAVVDKTFTADQKLVRSALEELRAVPTGTLATALPPRPMRHEIVEIESKEDGGARWIVVVKTTLKNPLPFMSKRVGHLLEDMPKTRDQRRRYLIVEEGDRWGVKLDLERVVARDVFAARFMKAIERKKPDEAEAMLEHLPPPPDEANALKKSDRLKEALLAELAKAKRAPKE
jgi:hypothetical protein